jgi:uncharacterized protein
VGRFGGPKRYPEFASRVGGSEILIMVKFDETALAGLCERHGVESLRLFGSAARGEERLDSDLDLLVRFTETKSLIELVRIEREFEEHFGRPVDLVTEGELSPYIRDEVLSQASPLYGPRG